MYMYVSIHCEMHCCYNYAAMYGWGHVLYD